MNRLRLILTIFILTILFNGCSERKIVVENRAVVSIAPLKPLVENILGDDFEISVLVPQGASPETFEPTLKQLRDVETARFVFGTGLLEFEQELLHRVARNEQIINLSQGIELITGTCSHAHHNHNATCEHDCTHEHHRASQASRVNLPPHRSQSIIAVIVIFIGFPPLRFRASPLLSLLYRNLHRLSIPFSKKSKKLFICLTDNEKEPCGSYSIV